MGVVGKKKWHGLLPRLDKLSVGTQRLRSWK